MAKEPIFSYNGQTFIAALKKVDREKVYGWTEMKYLDSDGKACHFVSMLEDGKTMLESGGLAIRTIDTNGNEVDKSTLEARLPDGTIAPLLPSVFDTENILSDDKSIDDYFLLDVKSVYQLSVSEGYDSLLNILKQKKVLYFTFNYRAGYEADDAFLVHQNENIFAVVGKLNDYQFATLNSQVSLSEEGEETSDDFDFGMM